MREFYGYYLKYEHKASAVRTTSASSERSNTADTMAIPEAPAATASCALLRFKPPIATHGSDVESFTTLKPVVWYSSQPIANKCMIMYRLSHALCNHTFNTNGLALRLCGRAIQCPYTQVVRTICFCLPGLIYCLCTDPDDLLRPQ